jgi:hypothetical protein
MVDEGGREEAAKLAAAEKVARVKAAEQAELDQFAPVAGVTDKAISKRAKCEDCAVKHKNYGLPEEGYRKRWCGACAKKNHPGAQNRQQTPRSRGPDPPKRQRTPVNTSSEHGSATKNISVVEAALAVLGCQDPHGHGMAIGAVWRAIEQAHPNLWDARISKKALQKASARLRSGIERTSRLQGDLDSIHIRRTRVFAASVGWAPSAGLARAHALPETIVTVLLEPLETSPLGDCSLLVPLLHTKGPHKL